VYPGLKPVEKTYHPTLFKPAVHQVVRLYTLEELCIAGMSSSRDTYFPLWAASACAGAQLSTGMMNMKL